MSLFGRYRLCFSPLRLLERTKLFRKQVQAPIPFWYNCTMTDTQTVAYITSFLFFHFRFDKRGMEEVSTS